jgi:hypothetical protein
MIMCDEQRNVKSLAAGLPEDTVHRAEEVFPALGGSLVSILCLCAHKMNLSLVYRSYMAKYTIFVIGMRWFSVSVLLSTVGIIGHMTVV